MFKIPHWIDRSELDKPLLSVGVIYDFEVLSIKNGISRNEKERLELSLKIFTPEGKNPTFKCDLYFHPKMMWIISNFFNSVGCIDMYDSNSIDFEKVKSCIGQVIFKVKKDDKTKIEIKDFVKRDQQKSNKLPFDDEINF